MMRHEFTLWIQVVIVAEAIYRLGIMLLSFGNGCTGSIEASDDVVRRRYRGNCRQRFQIPFR
jgi:hypothetical protein